MKKIIFNTLFIFLIFSKITVAQNNVERDALLDFITTPPESTEQQSSMSQQEVVDAFMNPQSATTTLSSELSPEEQEFMKLNQGESASDFINRVRIENALRTARGETPLPDPVVQIHGQQIRTSASSTENLLITPISQINQQLPPQRTRDSSTLNTLINQLFWAGLVVAVVLAIVMVILGAIQYMTTDAVSGKGAGKERIKAAVAGLVLAFSTVIILNTINPSLTELNLTFERIDNIQLRSEEILPVELGSREALSPFFEEFSNSNTPQDPGPIIGRSEQELRAFFAQNGVNINNPPCNFGQTKGCTNVAGLGEAAVRGVVRVKRDSGANITITGGTEPGHQTHGVGKPIVDLRHGSHSSGDRRLDDWITRNAIDVRQTSLGPVYIHANGDTFLDEKNGNNPRHWHVVFK